MRLALSVSATFFLNYLLNRGRIFVHAYLLTYLLVAAKIAPVDLMKLLWGLMPILFALGFVPSTYGRNMGWITALPISRVTLALTAIGSALAMLVVASLLAWPGMFIIGGRDLFWSTFAGSSIFIRKFAGSFLPGGSVKFELNAVLYGVLVALLAGMIAFPRDVRKIAEWKLGRRAKAPTLKTVAPSLIAIVVFFLLVGKFASYFLFLMVMYGCTMYLLFYSVDRTYGLPPRRRRFYLRGTIALFLVIVLGSFVALRIQLNSEDRRLAFGAQEMFPSGMSGMSEARLSRFAATASDSDELRKALQVWRKEWYPNSRIPFEAVKGLFDRPEFFPPLFANVRNAEIPNEFFMAYLATFSTEREGVKTETFPSVFLRESYARKLSDAEIGKLLVSDREDIREFARNWLGFRLERANAERIVASLRTPPIGLGGMDLLRERVAALEIISAMAAKDLRFEDVFGPRSAAVMRGLEIPPKDADCGECSSKGAKPECPRIVVAHCTWLDLAKSYGISAP